MQTLTLESFTTFGDLLKYLRQRERLTQRELGLAVGYGEAQINRLERNTRLPEVSLIAAQFITALHLQNDPQAASRLIELAAYARGEPVPASFNFTRTIHHKVVEDFNISPAKRNSNLLVQTTSFIGREDEVTQLTERATTMRLITLTGAGGCGKTRLSLKVAMGLKDVFADGIWLVEFAPITDGALVPRSVANLFGLIDQSDMLPQDMLTRYLAAKHALLILDNCEHIIEACAQFAMHLLQHCPHIHLLVTSRESLSIPGEVTWRVPSLSQTESVHLFIARALAYRPDFAPTDQDLAVIADVCQQLDGIPLAIELAAARVTVLTPQQIAHRLNDGLGLLTSTGRGVVARHQTLRATIMWSVQLLTELERNLLMTLSVFAGGFTAKATEAMCDQTDTLTTLSSLVNKSLVLADFAEGMARYRMLETIRQYAEELLSQADRVATIRNLHLNYCLGLAEQAEPWLQTKHRQEWLERLACELVNLRAALIWCQESSNHEAQLRLSSALCWFWNFQGHMTEGQHWLERALALTEVKGNTRLRAKGFYAACSLSWRQGEYAMCCIQANESVRIWRNWDDSRALAHALAWLSLAEGSLGHWNNAKIAADESIALFISISDDWGLALALTMLAGALGRQDTFGAADEAVQEANRRSRATGDPWIVAVTTSCNGTNHLLQGKYQEARDLYEQATLLRQLTGDRMLTARSMSQFGEVAEKQGDYIKAIDAYRQALALDWSIGNFTRVLRSMLDVSRLLGLMGNLTQAVRLLAVAQELDKNSSARTLQYFSPEPILEAARATLGEVAFSKALAMGLAMSLDDAVAFALQV